MISLILKWEKTISISYSGVFFSCISYLQQQQHHLPTTQNPLQGSVPHQRRRWRAAQGCWVSQQMATGKRQDWLPLDPLGDESQSGPSKDDAEFLLQIMR